MTEILFTVTGTPAPQGSKRHVGRGRMIESSAALAPWREHIAWATRKATRQHDPADGPVSVALTFVMPRPQRAKPGTPATKRPDLDKLVRAVLDALVMGAAMRDDSQVTRIIATKRLAEPGEQPRVDILLNTESD